MSLREEIQSVLDYISEYGLDCEPYTDKILKLIEKRIDEIMEPLIEEQKNRNTVSQYNSFALQKLNQVKELLK